MRERRYLRVERDRDGEREGGEYIPVVRWGGVGTWDMGMVCTVAVGGGVGFAVDVGDNNTAVKRMWR